MNALITGIGILSLLDLHCTLCWIGADPNMEANPICRWLWTYNSQLFIWSKILMTVAFCIIAYKTKDNKLMRRLIWLPFCVYLFITYLHAQILI